MVLKRKLFNGNPVCRSKIASTSSHGLFSKILGPPGVHINYTTTPNIQGYQNGTLILETVLQAFGQIAKPELNLKNQQESLFIIV